MLKLIKKALVVTCALAISLCLITSINFKPTNVSASMTVEDALAEFVMEEGASVRIGVDVKGLRFNAILSQEAYNVLDNEDAQFGMLIVPKDYVTEGYELTPENVFGANAVYQPNVKASEVESGKKAIVQIDTPTIQQYGNNFRIFGSLVGVLEENIARGFIGRAYVLLDGEYYFADYTDGLVDNNTRSMAYVAKCAIDHGESNRSTLQTAYVNKVKDSQFDYTINKVTVEIDGSVHKEVITSGVAQFGTEIVEVAERQFGFEGLGVDTFLGMEDAEFNIIYKATPINVVVDADATQTELYAANELAGYISQVTGVLVNVGTQSSEYNNIYISTNESLGLSMDSFRLSTDANKNVHINGVDERGTLYGVYEYEEACLGVKFLSETYTHVPVTNRQVPSLTEEQCRNYVPSFDYRTYMNNGIGLDGNDNVKYSSHLRFIAQFSQEKRPTELMDQVQYFMPWMADNWIISSHSLATYAAVGAYLSGLTQLVDCAVDNSGKIVRCQFLDTAPSDKTYGKALDDNVLLDVCYSSDIARDWVAKGLKYMIDTYPDMEYFMLGQADKTAECQCSTCSWALSSWNLTSSRKYKADLVCEFIKDVVDEVNGYGTKYSSKKIVIFAYQKTEQAPKNAIDMPNNVYVQWAPIDQERYFPLDDTNPKQWKTQLGMDDSRFLVWSYEVDFAYYFNYYPTMHTWVENFQIYKELGVETVMMQSTWNTSGVADSYLEAYVASKLLWNYEPDNASEMNALIASAKAEFIKYFYGESAELLVNEYYDEFDALYQRKFASSGLKSGRSFTENELRPLLNLLEQAIAQTDNLTYKSHLEMLALTPRYMLVQYCGVSDDNLANDMAIYATRSREGTLLSDDSYLRGLSFLRGYSNVLAIEYDGMGRISSLTLEIPDKTEWYNQSPRFTADYVDGLYAQGIRTITMTVNSSANTGLFTTKYCDSVSWNGPYVFELVETTKGTADGGGLWFSYVDVSGNVHSSGLTIGTTLVINFSYS